MRGTLSNMGRVFYTPGVGINKMKYELLVPDLPYKSPYFLPEKLSNPTDEQNLWQKSPPLEPVTKLSTQVLSKDGHVDFGSKPVGLGDSQKSESVTKEKETSEKK